MTAVRQGRQTTRNSLVEMIIIPLVLTIRVIGIAIVTTAMITGKLHRTSKILYNICDENNLLINCSVALSMGHYMDYHL